MRMANKNPSPMKQRDMAKYEVSSTESESSEYLENEMTLAPNDRDMAREMMMRQLRIMQIMQWSVVRGEQYMNTLMMMQTNPIPETSQIKIDINDNYFHLL